MYHMADTNTTNTTVTLAPSRAFALSVQRVVDAETTLRNHAHWLKSAHDDVMSIVDGGRTVNSLGEVQSKGSNVDSACGRLAEARHTAVALASMFANLADLPDDDRSIIRSCTNRSVWVAKLVDELGFTNSPTEWSIDATHALDGCSTCSAAATDAIALAKCTGSASATYRRDGNHVAIVTRNTDQEG